jgi:hypothetical protein
MLSTQSSEEHHSLLYSSPAVPYRAYNGVNVSSNDGHPDHFYSSDSNNSSNNNNNNVNTINSTTIDKACPSSELNIARQYLYGSHLSGQMAEQVWQFSILLLLGAFSQYQSLMLVSTYGLFSGLGVTFTGGWFGQYIDRNNTHRVRC